MQQSFSDPRASARSPLALGAGDAVRAGMFALALAAAGS